MQNSPLSPALPIRLHLQAIHPARNIARHYAIEASADLFGHWIVELNWGRIGTRGQGRRVSFEDALEATCFVQGTLIRRASAERRIGAPYVLARCLHVPSLMTSMNLLIALQHESRTFRLQG
jgi:predicted DNA-binding WGR domain protein